MDQITYSRNALKALGRLPTKRRVAIRARIRDMAAGVPSDVVALQGRPGYRLRVGRYRVIFLRDGDTIAVIDVDVRGSVY